MLKIDRSFVLNMLGDRQDLAIVEGVIGLSQTVRLRRRRRGRRDGRSRPSA
jgi:EAL domain-containing protein (putative c-di-GMP-specific phosphodiesterase class I)